MTRRPTRDAGMATVELAVALPTLVLVLGVCLSGVWVGVERVRVQDAAMQVARALARGDPAAAGALLRATAPAGASYTTSISGADLTATVRARLSVGGGLFGSVTVTDSATAAVEPSAVP